MLASPAITPRPTTLRGRLPSLAAAAGIAVHVLVAVWVFAPALWGGRVLYFRDISTYFYPNLVFLGRSIAAGVFPLWNPAVDAGSPFLLVYPLDVLLVAFAGAPAALALGPPLHMLIASLGASALGRRLGLGHVAAWTCGLVFALSGFMFSAVNLVPLQQAAAWAPVVLLLALRCASRPEAVRVVLLACALALQVSTLAGEIVVQTAAAAAILLWRRFGARGAAALAAAVAIAALLSAPPLLGVASIVKDTHRGAGFSAAEAVAGSLSPVELAGVLLPRFFGDMHTMTGAGFWGQDRFLGGFPYLLSVYLGAAVLGLAAAAGRDRLWLLVAIAVLLALGADGPFSGILGTLGFFRTPVKFMFLASLGLALLAGRGLDRAFLRRAPWGTLLPGVAVAALALALWAAPEWAAAALEAFPPLAEPAAQAVVRTVWPMALLGSGLAALAAGVAATHGGRISAGAAALMVLDLLVVNGDVNRFAPAAFYALRPEVRALMDQVPRTERFRVFGYGIGNTPGLRFAPVLLRENSDVWLYYLDRQVLWGRAPVLDGLEGALDEDRTAWAPSGSTLDASEAVPALFGSVHPRLRLANVRWILSFAPLPADLVVERGAAVLPEVLEPLRLSELRDPLPRAFWVPAHRIAASRSEARQIVKAGDFDPRAVVILEPGAPAAAPSFDPAAAATVAVDIAGPHDVRLRARTPPGYVVLLSGWDAGWQARAGDGAAIWVLRANDRYIALPTPGGERVFHLEYRPRWWPRSRALFALGAIATLAAVAASVRRRVSDAREATPPDRS